MKKLFVTTFLAVFAFINMLAQASMTGSGTESDPYRIFNANQLIQVGNFCGQTGVYFMLMNNIDLTDWIAGNNPGQGWEPIGVPSSPFKGVFDGNGKKITGFWINRSTTNYVGFFGYTSGATIKNLTIEGDVVGGSYTGAFVGYAYLNGTLTGLTYKGNISGAGYVGGVAGYSYANMNQITTEGDVTGSSDYVGGVVGYSKSTTNTISDVTMQGNVTASSASNVGGIAGYTCSAVDNAYYAGVVYGANQVGGAVGQCQFINATNHYINNVHTYGTVRGISNVGGVLGLADQRYRGDTMTGCYSYCEVTGSGNYVGGVTGLGIVAHTQCASYGDITGASYVGGIIGAFQGETLEVKVFTYGDDYYPSLKEPITVEKVLLNCYAIGNVTASGNYAGGLCGISDNCYGWTESYQGTYHYYTPVVVYLNLTDSYFGGVLKGKNNVGGIIGYGNHVNISRNYSNANINGTTYVGGIVGRIRSNTDNLRYQNGGFGSVLIVSYEKNSVLKSNMAVNDAVIATSTAGRIYGNKDASGVTVGVMNDKTEDNRTLYDSRLVISGVTHPLDGSEQNGVGTGELYLKTMASYVSHGWNFNNDWAILDTESFPYKKWQAAPPTITSELVSGDQTISGQSINGGTVYVKIADNDPLQATCSGNTWTLSGIAKLKSGQEVSMYVEASGKENSYRTKYTVGFPGSGTEADPWRIYDAYDLRGVYKPGYYKQMNDINLSSWINANSPSKGWLPVGFSGNEAVVYDGDNHKITNLWVNTTEDYSGLFSSFSIGTIKNLTVEAGLKGVKGANYTGILIGQLTQGAIENVNVKGNVTGKIRTGGIVGSVTKATLSKLAYTGHVTGTSIVGGIAGLGKTLCECKATDIVVTSSGTLTGGLAGGAAQVSLSEVNGTITCSSNSSEAYVGGLLGSLQGTTVTTCSADVTVTSSSPQGSAGGLIGVVVNYDSEVSNCSSAGTVTSTGEGSMTGGLVGDADGFIRNCYSTANVTGTDYTAGLVGYNYGTIDKCYASGNVSSVYHAAGLVGYNDGTRAMVTNCVAINKIVNVSDQSGWSIRVIGGYKNGAPDPDESNFGWEGMLVSVNDVPKTIDDDLLNGQSLTTAQTKSQDIYESLGWDFENVWAMGTDYPQLQWQTVATNATGDVDGDGSIDVADIVMIIDVIAGLRTDPATVAAADVDGDGTVDVADIVACIDLIAQQVAASPALTNRISRAAVGDYITAVMQGDKVDLSLNNQNQYTAFQMTVTLPEGLVLKNATMDKSRGEDHQLTVRRLNDQEYLLMGFSMDKDIIFGNSGRLLTLTTEGAANGEIHFGHILFATFDAESVRLDDASVQTSATGISNIELGIADAEVFDLQGRKVNGNAKSGLYIVNGKKVMVK